MRKFYLVLFSLVFIFLGFVVFSNSVDAVENQNAKIADGIYQIESALDRNYVIEVAGSGKNNGANIQVWQNRKAKNQQFKIKYINNSYYEITAVHSGKLMDVQNEGKTNGTNIQQCERTNCDAQRWIIKDAGNGYYNIISKCNGLFLDVHWAWATNGSNIQVCEGTTNNNAQRFALKKVEELKSQKLIEDGTYQIESALDKNYVLDIAGSGKNNGANVQVWQNKKSKNQQFRVKYIDSGYYEITAVHSGKLLDVQNEGQINGTNIQQCERTNCDAQRWIIKDAGNGYYNIVSKCNGLFLDVHWAWATNGSNIQVCEGTANNNAQRFAFRKVEEPSKPVGKKTIEDGTYQIETALSGSYVLEVANGSYSNGGNIQIWQNKSYRSQQFKVKYIDSGYYEITAVHSGKLLDVQNEGQINGTNIQQCERTNCDAQRWIIKDVGNGYYNIISKCNYLYLDVHEGWVRNGGNIQVCEGTANNNAQKFKFKKVEQSQEVGKRTIEDGIYQIQTGIDGKYVLEVANSSNSNGGNIQIWQNKNIMSQKFEVKYNNVGYYEITAIHSRKLLDVQNEGKTNGTNIQQCERTNCDAQRWIIKDAGNGYYNIISKCNDLYLDVHEGWCRNGANIQVCQGTANNNAQKFKFVKTKALAEKTYKISIKKNSNKVLDIAYGSWYNNANVQICFNDNVKQQMFNIKYVDNTYFKIVAVHSNKFLTALDNGNVCQSDTGDDNQLWYVKLASNGSFYIISKKYNTYLTVEGNSTADGANIKVAKKTNDESQMFKFDEITTGQKGTYGKSGKGQNLNYYKYGSGENVFFAVFEVHGFEDNWDYDGNELTNIANDFYNRLISEKNEYIAKNWTVYIMPSVNPDGLTYGWTNYGPGRTTVYSKAPGNKGIDINRSWQIPGTQYKRFTDNRNYNGTEGFQAYEAAALRDFLLKNKASNGQTILIDLHGWENSFIGDEEIGSKYFDPNFPSATKKYGRYGEQYLIAWARSALGARSALVELPSWIKSHNQAVNENLSGKYINSVMNMLNNVSINSPVRMAVRKVGRANREITVDEQFNIAFAGIMKCALPLEEELENFKKQIPTRNGIWIDKNSEKVVLELINGLTNSKYGVNNGYLEIVVSSEQENKYDEFIKELINSNKKYILSRTGNLYFRDTVNYEITSTDYEEFDADQPYDYVWTDDKILLDINPNKKGLLTDKEIMDSIIKLIEN